MATTLERHDQLAVAALDDFRKGLEKALTVDAEPLIQEALRKAEMEMRARVGAVVTQLVSQSDYRFDGTRLHISVDFKNLGGK